jgi:predicted TIM-barrel fold metal-dependent hydrolase
LFDTLTPFRERYPEGARHYLRRLWYDTALSASAVQMDALRALVGPDRILFGSDFPYVPDGTVEAESRDLDGYAGFDAEARVLMERKNAAALFPRFRSG